MRKLLITTVALLSLGAFANTVERAEELFESRADDVNNAIEAGKIYANLATTRSSVEEKANMLYKQSEAIYYVGGVTESRDAKEDIYDNGIKVSEAGVKLLKGNADTYEKEVILAGHYFWLGAHIGKRYEFAGDMSRALKAKKIKKMMLTVIETLSHGDVHEMGPHRVLGRVLTKLPGLLGGNVKEGMKHLELAFAETNEDGTGISYHGLNNLFLVEALRAQDLANDNNANKVRYCAILKEFSEQDPELLLDTRIPETAKEIQEAKDNMVAFACN